MRALLLASFLACACGPAVPGSNGDGGGGGNPDARVNRVDANNDCVTATYDGEQAPTALLVVLDASASMADSNKWTFASQAIVSALDQDVFDPVYVGLYVSPSGEQTGPSCIFGFPVACQSPPFPQIDLTLAGTDKSNAASGVRHDIKTWLTSHLPLTGDPDGSPLYNAIEAAIGSLRLWPEDGNRILLVVTDGSISCTSLSSRSGYTDCNGCNDWENPQNIIDLVNNAYGDPAQPVETFFLGVPGADTYDASACNYPPYHMRMALSAMAYAGSPLHVPTGCTGTTYSQTSADPSVPCHFDMTVPGGFSATAVADAISYIRGQAVGCTFDLPVPPPGQMLDLSQVNVSYTADGTMADLARRGDPTNQCLTTGCWDYTPDNRIELIGKACTDITAAASVHVSITTGCATIIL